MVGLYHRPMPDAAAEPAPETSALRRAWLVVEFTLLYFGIPLLFVAALDADRRYGRALIPALVFGGAVCFTYLLLNKRFDRRQLWNWAGCRAFLVPMLLRFAVCAAGLTAALLAFAPEALFSLPRRSMALWAAIMVLYPIFSAYPQEIMFRAFFAQRYAAIFASPGLMLVASAVAFGFGHIILNWVAVLLCVAGGAIFMHTYLRTRSLLAAAIEHGLYGNFLFTIGFGQFLYLGAGD